MGKHADSAKPMLYEMHTQNGLLYAVMLLLAE